MNLNEDDVEQIGLGWRTVHGPDIAPDAPNVERPDYAHVVLERRRQQPSPD